MNNKHILELLIFGLLVGAGWAQEKQKTEEKPAQATAAAASATAPQAVHSF